MAANIYQYWQTEGTGSELPLLRIKGLTSDTITQFLPEARTECNNDPLNFRIFESYCRSSLLLLNYYICNEKYNTIMKHPRWLTSDFKLFWRCFCQAVANVSCCIWIILINPIEETFKITTMVVLSYRYFCYSLVLISALTEQKF